LVQIVVEIVPGCGINASQAVPQEAAGWIATNGRLETLSGFKGIDFLVFLILCIQRHEVHGPFIVIGEIFAVQRYGLFDVRKLRTPVQIQGGVPFGGTYGLGQKMLPRGPHSKSADQHSQAQDDVSPEPGQGDFPHGIEKGLAGAVALPVNSRIAQGGQGQGVGRDVHVEIEIAVETDGHQSGHDAGADAQGMEIPSPAPDPDHFHQIDRKGRYQENQARPSGFGSGLHPVVVGVTAASNPVIIIDVPGIHVAEIAQANPRDRVVLNHGKNGPGDVKSAVQVFRIFELVEGRVDAHVGSVGQNGQAQAQGQAPVLSVGFFGQKQDGRQEHGHAQRENASPGCGQEKRNPHEYRSKKRKRSFSVGPIPGRTGLPTAGPLPVWCPGPEASPGSVVSGRSKSRRSDRAPSPCRRQNDLIL